MITTGQKLYGIEPLALNESEAKKTNSLLADQELFDWYGNGAKKTDTMSDKDYEVNKSNALVAQNNQLLSNNLSAQQGALAKAQTNAQQSASINNDKLMKYIGQKQLASGLTMGQTGSDFINANNAYVQNRAAINNNFSAQNADLLQQYASNKLAVNENALKNETAIFDKYRTLEREDEATAKLEAANKADAENFNAEYLWSLYSPDYLADGIFSESEREHALGLLDKYNLSEDDKKHLINLIDQYKYSNNYGVNVKK